MEHRLHGIIPPMVTPFTAEGGIDWDGTRRIIDFLVEGGVHGLFVTGSTGEFVHLSHEERVEFWRFAVEQVAGRVPLLVGAGSASTAECVDLCAHAEEVGVDAVVVVTPFYFRLSPAALFAHFSAVAQATRLPLVLYSIPALTGNELDLETVCDLARQHDNIIGIKDSVRHPDHTIGMLAAKRIRDDFLIFTGTDAHLLPVLLAGGDGGVPGLANFAPSIVVGLYDAVQRGDLNAARTEYRRVIALAHIYDIASPALAAVKAAAGMMGAGIESVVRPPAPPVDEADRITIKRVLVEAGLLNDR
jgi:4-hydroxy-tetrahydrodipicolinate synthase